MNVLNLFQKGSSRNVLSLKSEKGMSFLTTKVLVLAKIGGDFPPKKVKRGIFSMRGTSMVTIKQRESDARDWNTALQYGTRTTSRNTHNV